jgi:hypothetical protein
VGLILKFLIMWKVYLIEFLVVLIISIVWVNAIDKMKNEHPDYKGEDFLNFEEDEKENNDN